MIGTLVRLVFTEVRKVETLCSVFCRDIPKKKAPLRSSKKPKQEEAGSVELPGDFLPVHTVIEYKCASHLYQHAGSSRRTCLKSGRWSGRHVSCTPGENSNPTFKVGLLL